MEIGFVNFNQEALRRAGKVLKMLQGQGSIDELGLGRIRDVFSNAMFPGLSVLQTRAKYFLLLPALYAFLEHKRIADSREARAIVREYEIKLTRRMIEGSPEGSVGIIGADSLRENRKYVKYDPTYVYMAGMQAYGLLKCPGNLYAVLAERSNTRRNLPIRLRNDNGEEDSDELDGLRQLFVTCGFDYKFDSHRELSISLNRCEAEFLKRQICKALPDSLIAHVLESSLYKTITGYDFECLEDVLQGNVPDNLLRIYRLSVRYSRFAYLLRLYYAMLYDRNVGACDAADERLKDFEDYVDVHKFDFFPECIEEILEYAAPQLTETSSISFCREAATMVANSDFNRLARLLINREQAIKGVKRSKLSNPKECEPGKPFEVPALMTYRWSTIVRNVLNDISEGLGNE